MGARARTRSWGWAALLPGLGLLASCTHRAGYPNATFTRSGPRLRFDGTATATAVAAREQQASRMTDSLFYRIA